MAESRRKIVLRSSDEKEFEVEVTVALESGLLKIAIEDTYADITIPIKIKKVTGNILAKVIEYCKRHVDAAAIKAVAKTGDEKLVDDDLKAFDAEFVKVDQATLFHMIMAADFLDIKGLLELTCQAAADSIKDKTPEEARKIFNIVNDFTREEEELVRRENAWAFV